MTILRVRRNQTRGLTRICSRNFSTILSFGANLNKNLLTQNSQFSLLLLPKTTLLRIVEYDNLRLSSFLSRQLSLIMIIIYHLN